MRFKALVVSALVIGSSSLALAQPAFEGGVDVRDHRYVASWGHRPMWMTLSLNDKIARNGVEYISLRRTKPLKTLKLQATSGKTSIKDVTIQFANGQSQTVCLNQTIANGSFATIDLSGNYRNVVSLQLTGSSGRRASFEVLGV